MKITFKHLLRWILTRISESIIRIYHPKIIAITGSVGKTSTKQAIAALFLGQEGVRVGAGNLNTEFGVPLTIIGLNHAPVSSWGWLKAIIKGWGVFLLRQKSYPHTLVLEMAADRPGDIELLTRIAPPEIAILTGISPVHLEYFLSIDEIAREKSWIIKRLPADGRAIISYEDEKAWGFSKLTSAPVITYGFADEAKVKASDVRYRTTADAGHPRGILFKLHYQGSSVPCLLVDVVGRGSVEAALAATALGIDAGLNLIEIIERLRFTSFPPGRMHIISGIKQTIIIDDTYNSSPRAAYSALEVLSSVHQDEGRRTWAVFGDMAELGVETENEHRRLGSKVVEAKPDHLIVVGPAARWIADEAQAQGYPKDHILKFSDAREAGRVLQDNIEIGDCLLVKGSQIMRMERIVKELMLDPAHAESLLVRQEDKWM